MVSAKPAEEVFGFAYASVLKRWPHSAANPQRRVFVGVRGDRAWGSLARRETTHV
jgi:hypothetical protein